MSETFRPRVIGFDESRLDNLRDLLTFAPKTLGDANLVRGVAINLLDQRDRLWAAAQRVLNKAVNPNYETYGLIVPHEVLDMLGNALNWCRPRQEDSDSDGRVSSDHP